MRWKSLLREPLLHFLLAGAVLFFWFEWRGGAAGPGSTRIAITPGLVGHLAASFARTWQRPPDEAELKGLIDEHVKEEIATREAMASGLDRDDTIVRRRLRQKLEFLVEEDAAQLPPTDAELQAWLEKHRDAFRIEPQVALRQVFVSPERRGAAAREAAGALLARLRAAGPDAAIDELGDPSLLPQELPLGPAAEVARVFGDAFAGSVEALPAGEWSGPIESGYGLHLVLVGERLAAVEPPLARVRAQVEREVLAERKRAQLEAFYERLLRKYTVEIQMPKEPAAKVAVEGAGG